MKYLIYLVVLFLPFYFFAENQTHNDRLLPCKCQINPKDYLPIIVKAKNLGSEESIATYSVTQITKQNSYCGAGGNCYKMTNKTCTLIIIRDDNNNYKSWCY